jgi:WD40 repeat protein
VRIWDVRSGRTIQTFQNEDYVDHLTWSPDGKLLAGGASVWDVASGKLLVESSKEFGRSIFDWSPDGKWLLSYDGSEVSIWDWQTGQPQQRMTTNPVDGIELDWSPDGAFLATTAVQAGLRIWDVNSGRIVRSHAQLATRLDWSPDSKAIILLMFHSSVGIWRRDSGELRAFEDLTTPTITLSDVACSPTGNRVAGASWAGKVGVWDLVTGTLLQTFDRPMRPGASGKPTVCWSPDGTRLASGGSAPDDSAIVWNVETGEQVQELERAGIQTVDFAPKGGILAVGGELWHLDSGRVQHVADNGACAWSPDGRRLAVVQHDGEAIVWDAQTGSSKPFDRAGLRGIPTWSASGQYLAAATIQHTVQVLDVTTGQRALTLVPLRNLQGLALSPEGHYQGSPRNERTRREIVYVVLTDDGTQETFTPDEFEQKYNWRNDPSRARLIE